MSDDTALMSVTKRLVERATRARRTAFGALGGIILVICAGGIAFGYASKLVVKDASEKTNVAQAKLNEIYLLKDDVSASANEWLTAAGQAQVALRGFTRAVSDDHTIKTLREGDKRRVLEAQQDLARAKETLSSRSEEETSGALLRGILENAAKYSPEVKSFVLSDKGWGEWFPTLSASERLLVFRDRGRIQEWQNEARKLREKNKEIDAKLEKVGHGSKEEDALFASRRASSLTETKMAAANNAALYESWQKEIEKGSEQLVPAVDTLRDRIGIALDVSKLTGRLDTLNATAKNLPSSVLTAPESTVVLSILVTRAAIGVLVFFLSQVLLSLYRYNTRLEHYFTGRYDALVLRGNDLTSTNKQRALIQLMGELSAQTVDFGKMPSAPSKDAVELAKTLLNTKGHVE